MAFIPVAKAAMSAVLIISICWAIGPKEGIIDYILLTHQMTYNEENYHHPFSDCHNQFYS